MLKKEIARFLFGVFTATLAIVAGLLVVQFLPDSNSTIQVSAPKLIFGFVAVVIVSRIAIRLEDWLID